MTKIVMLYLYETMGKISHIASELQNLVSAMQEKSGTLENRTTLTLSTLVQDTEPLDTTVKHRRRQQDDADS